MPFRIRTTGFLEAMFLGGILALLLTSCEVVVTPTPVATVYTPAVVVEGPPPPVVPPPPPPPLVVLPAVPRVVYSPFVRMDYVYGLDYDVFYVGGYFYTCHQGHWYIANRPGAGWVGISVGYVPESLRSGPPQAGWRSKSLASPAREVTSFRESLPAGVLSATKSQTMPPRATPAAPGRAPEGPPGQVKPSKKEDKPRPGRKPGRR